MENSYKNKIKHSWSVICGNSITDTETNNISLNNIIEQIQINYDKSLLENNIPEKGIIVPVNFEIVSMWQKIVDKNNDISFDAKIELTDPTGKLLGEFPYKLEIKKDLERLRAKTKFNGLKITIPGEYIFTIKIKDGKNFISVGEAYLQVKIAIKQQRLNK